MMMIQGALAHDDLHWVAISRDELVCLVSYWILQALLCLIHTDSKLAYLQLSLTLTLVCLISLDPFKIRLTGRCSDSRIAHFALAFFTHSLTDTHMHTYFEGASLSHSLPNQSPKLHKYR